MKKRVIAFLMILALMVSVFAGCGSTAAETTETADTTAAETADTAADTEAEAADTDAQTYDYEFTFVCPIVGLEYWNMCADGIAAADAEFGTTTQVVGTTDPSSALTEIVNNMTAAIAAKPDGIFVYAGLDCMPNLIQEAADQGIPVVAIDSDCSDTTNRIAYVGTNPYNAGYAAGEAMVEATGGEGTIAVLMSSVSAEKEMAEVEAFKDAIAGTNLQIVVTEESGGDLATGVTKLEAIAQTYPDLTAVLGTSAYDVQAAAKVKDEYGLDWHLIGYDDQEDTLNYIRKGLIDAIVVQDPYMMGYLSVKALIEYNETGTVSEEIVDTGTITVNAENVETYKNK